MEQFEGSLFYGDDDDEGLRVSAEVGEGRMRLRTASEVFGTWDLDTISIEQTGTGSFTLTVEGDRFRFEPFDIVGFGRATGAAATSLRSRLERAQESQVAFVQPASQPPPPSSEPPRVVFAESVGATSATVTEKLRTGAATHLRLAWVLLGASALLLVASFLPWGTVGFLSLTGASGDGYITAVAALVIATGALMVWPGGKHRPGGLTALVASLAASAVGVVDGTSIVELTVKGRFELFAPSLGVGLVLVVLSALTAVVVSVLILFRRPKANLAVGVGLVVLAAAFAAGLLVLQPEDDINEVLSSIPETTTTTQLSCGEYLGNADTILKKDLAPVMLSVKSAADEGNPSELRLLAQSTRNLVIDIDGWGPPPTELIELRQLLGASIETTADGIDLLARGLAESDVGLINQAGVLFEQADALLDEARLSVPSVCVTK